MNYDRTRYYSKTKIRPFQHRLPRGFLKRHDTIDNGVKLFEKDRVHEHGISEEEIETKAARARDRGVHRVGLKPLCGKRHRFTAIVEDFGTKRGYMGDEETLLLREIVCCGEVVADHIWLTVGATIDRLSLKTGDTVEFDARVKRYQKGYFGRREDVYKAKSKGYKLSRPTKWKVLRSQSEPQSFENE